MHDRRMESTNNHKEMSLQEEEEEEGELRILAETFLPIRIHE